MLDVYKVDASLRAAEILEKNFGKDDPTVMLCLDQAALTLAVNGMADRAIPLVERTCAHRASIPKDAQDPLILANGERHHAWFLSLAGRNAEAIRVYEPVLADIQKHFGNGHHFYALTEAGYAMALLDTGSLEKADEVSTHALAIAEPAPGKFHPAVVGDQRCHIRLARACCLVESVRRSPPETHASDARLAHARELLESAWEIYYYSLSTASPWRARMVKEMIDIATMQGDTAMLNLWNERKASAGYDPNPAIPVDPPASGDTQSLQRRTINRI